MCVQEWEANINTQCTHLGKFTLSVTHEFRQTHRLMDGQVLVND